MDGEFRRILCHDRCPTYVKYHKGEGQFCWAHFKRNILGVLEILKQPKRRGSAAMRWPYMLACSACGIGSEPAPVSDMARSHASN